MSVDFSEHGYPGWVWAVVVFMLVVLAIVGISLTISAKSDMAAAPKIIVFEETPWKLVGEVVDTDVMTTEAIINGAAIYRLRGDLPPYDAIYIERAPNSGRYYKYVQMGSTPAPADAVQR